MIGSKPSPDPLSNRLLPCMGWATGALAALTHAAQLWPIAPLVLFAAITAWLFDRRLDRCSAMAVARTRPAQPAGRSRPERAPAPLPADVVARALPAPIPQAQGADLAARARFVAMRFAFPEPSMARETPMDWPLQLSCQPTHFSLTPGDAALGYRLEFCNRGAEALGPLIIRADLVAAESLTAPDRHAEFTADGLPQQHYLDRLPAGENVALTGQLRLPLAEVVAMRLGEAELLMPLMRVCAESTGESQLAFSVSACFAIGLPPLAAGGGIRPFRLDKGRGLWRKLAARRLARAEPT